MKLNVVLLTLSMLLLTISGFSNSNFNTEDNRIGCASIEERLQAKADQTQDKKLLRAEKKSYQFEKRFSALSHKVNKRLANGAGQTTTGKTSMSTLALVFGASGFLLLFLIPILGILLGTAGFVLGLVSLKKEGSNVANILGIVFGGLTFFFFLLAVLIIASWSI